MAISFVNVSVAGGSNVTSITVAVPSGVQNGDFLFAQISVAFDRTVSAPSGWTQLDVRIHHSRTANNGRTYLYYRNASSEPANYTWTISGGTTYVRGVIAAYRGVDQSSPIDGWSGQNSTFSNNATVTFPDVSVNGGGRWALRVIGGYGNQNWSFGSGLTQRWNGIQLVVRTAGADQQVSGSSTGTATGSFSGSGTTYGAAYWTIALKPATAATEQLSGRAIGTSAASGSVSVSRLLSGAAAGSGHMAAAPSVARLLAGQVRGEGALVGNLDYTRALSSTAIGSSGLQGAVTVERLLAGAAIGEGAMIVALLPESANLAGTAVGSGLLQGALVVERLLAGTALGSSSLTGTLSVERLLTGTALSESEASGAVIVTRALAGSAAGEGTLSGAPLVVRILAGAAVGEGVLLHFVPPPIAGLGIGLGEAVAIQAVTAVGVGVGLGEAVVPGVLAVEAAGLGLGDGLALVELPAQAMVLTTQVRLEPGDLVWLVAPLAGLQGRTGLCRVLAVEHDPDRGERRYRVQLVPLAEAGDMLATNELWRPPVAIDRATSLARLLRERRRDD